MDKGWKEIYITYTHETVKQVRESHCHGAEAISKKVVITITLRSHGITHSLGNFIVVKRDTVICCMEPTVSFFPDQWGFFTLYTLLFRKPSKVIYRF